jgi:hypothetical protein
MDVAPLVVERHGNDERLHRVSTRHETMQITFYIAEIAVSKRGQQLHIGIARLV